jgi:hypothetical protein
MTPNSPLDKSEPRRSRRCGCGCGGELPSNASDRQLYLTGHRQRKYQRQRNVRVREALAAVGVATNVNTTLSAAGSERRRRINKPRQARYLIVRQSGPNLTITGAILAQSKRAAEKRIGDDDPHTFAVAASHLPVRVGA